MAVTLTARSVGVMVSAALAAGWLGASLTHEPAPAQASRVVTTRSEPMPVPHAEKLRERMAEPPRPSRGRNPFVYGARTTTRRDHQQHGDESVAPPPPPLPMAPPVPIFKLS